MLSRNTLADGHPIRTSGGFTICMTLTGRNTLADGHPIRTGRLQAGMEPRPRRNTLADGHPIRTYAEHLKYEAEKTSKYPR